MSFYLDASLLVTLFTREPQRPAVRDWMDRNRGQELAASEWVATEVSSALALKFRVGALTLLERATAQSLFSALWTEALTIIPMRDAQFQLAARLCHEERVSVRAGDALHLAIARENSLTICTRDRGMATAGRALAMEMVLVGESD